ncbi:MAG: serine/threonine-protein kinase [Planctomycetota bacterium]|jgi:tetratricopeptide (TPR) repeat protein
MSAPGQIGPYRIDGELGRGGMGVVYRAVHSQLGRPVALKVLSAGTDGPAEETIARFHREAQSAAKLADHPGIVGVHDTGRDGDIWWLAMDLADGRSLDEWLDEEALPLPDTIRIGAECAEALAHAHAGGVLHRDVKPANIMWAHGGIARLTDFGLARPLDAGPDVQKLTRTGVVVGTPAYMPPEQLLGKPVDARADVYALGATLYELVAGHAPFTGGSMHTLIGQVLRQDPTPLREGPPGLAAVVARCLEKQPDRRYPSAAALAEDLRRLQRGESVAVRLPGPVTRSWRTVRRRPVAAVTVTAVVSALAGVGLTAAVMGGREQAAHTTLQDKTARREAVDLATAQAAAYQAAVRVAGALLRDCAAHGRGVTLPKAQLDEVLGGLAAAARDLQAGHSRTESARGLVPLGRALTGDVAAFAELQGLAESGHDPFLWLWWAQALLARYAQVLRMPAISVGDRVKVFQFDEPPEVRSLLTSATKAIGHVRGSPVWTALPSGAALRRWAEGAAALEAKQPAEALAALVPLTDDPVLGDDARLLVAIARYLQGEYHEAAALWEHLAQGRSAVLLERAAVARLSAASVAAVQGKDAAADLQAAIAGLTAALERPGDRRFPLRSRHVAHRFLASLASDRGADPEPHLRAALADAEAMIALAPDDALGHRMRAGAFLERATAAERRGTPAAPWLAQARASLDTAARHGPEDGESLLLRSQITRREGEAAIEARTGGDLQAAPAEAVRLAEAALDQLGPTTKTIHTLALARLALGRARSEAGESPVEQYRLAQKELRLVVEQDPAFIAARVNLARAYRNLAVEFTNRSLGNPHNALRLALHHCSETLTRAPNNIAALSLRGTAERELGEQASDDSEAARAHYTRAVDDFTAALERRPKDPRLLHNRGLAHDRLGRTHRESDPAEAQRILMLAVADYNAALEAAPDMWKVKLDGARTVAAIAGLKGATQEPFLPWYDSAITQCTHLIRDGHTAPEVYVTRAQAWRLRGYWLTRAEHDPAESYAAAHADCTAALTADPTHWRAYAVRGMTYEQQDRWSEAARAYADGLRAAPGHTWLTELLRAASQRTEKR